VNPEMRIALAAGLFGLLGAVIGGLISYLTTRASIKAERRRWLLDRRIEAYQSFLSILAELRERRDDSDQARDRVWRALTPVRMFGTPRTTMAAQAALDAMVDVLFPDAAAYANPDAALALREKLFLNEVREELGEVKLHIDLDAEVGALALRDRGRPMTLTPKGT
jgi:hypothetical protein